MQLKPLGNKDKKPVVFIATYGCTVFSRINISENSTAKVFPGDIN